MRTVRTKVYKFEELDDGAKQKAIEQWRNAGYDYQHYFDEISDSVKSLCEVFNLKTGRQYSDLRWGHIDDNILELKGVRLYKYIVNNYWNSLYKRKFYGAIGDNRIIIHPCIKVNRYDMSKGAIVNSSNFYYSRITFDNCCVLTGICYDNDILQPIYDFLKKPDINTTLEDLFRDVESAISKCYRDTEDWIYSDEFITDEIKANEIEFTKNGKQFHS